MQTKVCSKCSIEQPIGNFYAIKGVPANPCKGCKKARRQSPEGREAKRRADRAYEERHRERRNAQRLKIATRHFQENEDRRKVLANSACVRCGCKLETLHSDKCVPCRKVVSRVRRRVSGYIKEALPTAKNGRRTFKFLPYTPSELVAHLESRFEVGMSWENYGEWEIDHIKPQSFFQFELERHPEVLADPSIQSWDEIKNPLAHPDVVECNALSNLRPLWGEENRKRSNKVTAGDIFIETMVNLRSESP